LLGLEAIREIILERNLESLPFYSYLRFKYNSAPYNKGSQNRMPAVSYIKHNSNTNFISEADNAVVHTSGFKGSKVLKSMA
jgi:hypothetical protein